MRTSIPNLPIPSTEYEKRLTTILSDLFRTLATKIDLATGGYFSVKWNTATSAPPAAGAPGDFVANSNPTELGPAGSKYILQGWTYASGAWKESRTLTGN
jgi:hypothetical protein